MSIFDKLFKKNSVEFDIHDAPAKTEVDINKLLIKKQVIINPDKIASKILEDWDYTESSNFDYSSLDNKELLRKIEQKDLEILDLKMEVSYYERYLKFLDDNFIFISKSTKNIQDIFDKIGEADE